MKQNNKSNPKVNLWFVRHKREIELLQKTQPGHPALAVLNKVIQFHNATGSWPSLYPGSYALIAKIFNDPIPLPIAKG